MQLIATATRRICLTALLALTALPLAAQPGNRGGSAGRMRLPDPVLFNGPPPPEDFLDLVGLDSTQYDPYRLQYTAFMEQTRPQRDSLMEFHRQIRDAMGPLDPSSRAAPSMGGVQGGDKIQKILAELEKRQKEFDEGLKTVLREPQLKRYEAWRKEEVAKAERETRERFGGPPR